MHWAIKSLLNLVGLTPLWVLWVACFRGFVPSCVNLFMRKYSENLSCYRCFSRNLPKIYRATILWNLFRCMWYKSQWRTRPTVFYNSLMLVVTRGHIYLNKPASLTWGFTYVCMTFFYCHVLKGKGVFWKFLRYNQTKSEASAVFFQNDVLKTF